MSLPGPSSSRSSPSRSRSRSRSRASTPVQSNPNSSLSIQSGSNSTSRTPSTSSTPHRTSSPLDDADFHTGQVQVKVKIEGDARIGLKRLITSTNVPTNLSTNTSTNLGTGTSSSLSTGIGMNKNDQPLGLEHPPFEPLTQGLIPDKTGKGKGKAGEPSPIIPRS